MPKSKAFENIHDSIFRKDQKLVVLNEEEKKIKIRWEAAFTKWLDEPALTTKAMVSFLMSTYGISKRMAYYDINSVLLLLGNVTNASKEWHRFVAMDMIKKGYALVEQADGSLDVKRGLAMIRAGEALGKVTRLDKSDGDPIPYGEIVPQSFEPTGDISVLGIKPIDNLKERQEKLRQKYGATNIEDAQIME